MFCLSTSTNDTDMDVDSDSDIDTGSEAWDEEYFKADNELNPPKDPIRSFEDIDRAAVHATVDAWSDTAEGKVLGNTEMLERILEHVSDMRTLLRAQRVNAKFRDVISAGNIKHIRRTLWLEPDPALTSATGQTYINPLVFSRSRALGFTSLREGGQNSHSSETSVLSSWRGMDVELGDQLRLRSLLSRPGSWKKMMLFQPKQFGHKGPTIRYRANRLMAQSMESYFDGETPMSLECLMHEVMGDSNSHMMRRRNL